MKNVKHSNKGGALLSVVIVMAIAGILGALAISIAYTNYTMKIVDKKSKDNFYSAEKVLEEICVGLENEASEHYKEAYTYVMSKYDEYNDIQTMEEEFETMFVVSLIEDIQVTGNSGKYLVGTKGAEGSEATGLYRFVKDNYGTAVYTITAENSQNIIDTLEDGLCLRNINVKYQDGNYHNTITTDIKIATPDVSFAMISAMPEIGEYSFIAEGGTLVSGNSGVKLEGKAYSGVGPEGTTNKTAITLNSGSTFDATNTKTILLVSKGDIALNGTSTFKTGEKTALWTESITANYTVANDTKTAQNLLDLSGRVYVKDDTTLNGTDNTLKLAGQYYGYSNKDNDASLSSAIIINGQNTSIDMSKLDTLLVAGTAFVGTKDSSYGTNVTANDILMGDSVAIKSNQLAYLVPTECEGIVTNPMTYAQYQTLSATPDWKQKALDTYLPTIRNSLSNYGNVEIVEVFSNTNGGTVYLYLNFASSLKASEYFMSYYGANKTQVDAFVNNYLKAITFNANTNDLTRIVTQGNYLKASTTENLKAQYSTGTGDVSSTAQELANYYSSYNALCRKLITNESALTNTEKTNTVYGNLVNETALQTFVSQVKSAGSGNYSSNISVSGNVVTIDGGTVDAIIVDNANSTSPYVVDSSHNKGILIATGDVNITGSVAATSWDGLIICGGKLTVVGSECHMKHNPDYIGKVMQLSCEVKVGSDMVPYDVLDFFTSGSNYSSSSSSDGMTLTDVRNCISYENYKSE